jgi:hypothetical protein
MDILSMKACITSYIVKIMLASAQKYSTIPTYNILQAKRMEHFPTSNDILSLCIYESLN